jgi:hypothetical protein
MRSTSRQHRNFVDAEPMHEKPVTEKPVTKLTDEQETGDRVGRNRRTPRQDNMRQKGYVVLGQKKNKDLVSNHWFNSLFHSFIISSLINFVWVKDPPEQNCCFIGTDLDLNLFCKVELGIQGTASLMRFPKIIGSLGGLYFYF